ncbi:Retrovirus-related Pol polyprotein from transposon RE1 [Cardamine amara subsp. amara]|uniref:Retrovirus-related Pol polyprotein from transposon RE1 n=1 Tax=Cardamine amara subsp. amara TaxID=228776 RepID=A0ABD1BNL9_CARAN
MKGKTFPSYCQEFRVICDSLSSIGKPTDEHLKVFTFLNGLSREYDQIVTVLQSFMSRSPAPTFNDVVMEVSNFTSKFQSYESVPDVSPHLAFQTQKGGFGQRGRGNYRGRGGYYNRGSFSTRGRGFSQQVNSSGWNQSSPTQSCSSSNRPVCQICGRVGHIALKCWNRFDASYQSDDVPQALAALRVSDTSGQEWFPDSGASAHITPSTAPLQSATPYNGPENVMVTDGSFQPITHVGSTVLNTTSGSIPLSDVLVCPSMQKSLLSVSKLCEDYPCGVFFDANHVYIIDLNTQKVVTRGPRRDNLYVLENAKFAAFYSNRQIATSDMIWHQRLGHANFQILQLLKNNKAISINKSSTTFICEPCQMGKSSQLPFYYSESSVMEPFDRLHCDLWGLSPVVSNQGFKYCAVFIDELSRYSWMFPLKAKSDFCDVFIGFQKQVENQFRTKIKVFQSDGGGEFTSTRFQNHLQHHGIRHLISCPSTPQQNGIAERKHRHLTELGLSMLFQSKTPLKFWVEAFYSANFISNLLPSAALKQRSPHEALLKHKPDYSFLRVFGSACYPCLRPFSHHKFELRSLQCVFLGYHTQYKGYRCFYPPTGRVYICRHVIFDETYFPFMDRYRDLAPRNKTSLLGAWQAADDNIPQLRTYPHFHNLCHHLHMKLFPMMLL